MIKRHASTHLGTMDNPKTPLTRSPTRENARGSMWSRDRKGAESSECGRNAKVFPRVCTALVLVLVSAAAGCSGGEGAHGAAAAAPAAGAKTEAPDTVNLDEAMLANIRVEPVRERTARRILTATGKVQLNEDRTSRVLAPLPGQVLGFQLRVGDGVQKEQILFSIKSREVAALVTDYLESERDRDLAEKTHAMTKDLFEHQAASRISFQQSEGDLAKAKAHVARAEEALRVLGLDAKEAQRTGGLQALVPVLSPLTGAVIERTVTNGQFVQADSTPLLTLADLSTVWVQVDVFERDIHLVQPGQKVRVTAAAYPSRSFIASVERIGDKVDLETRTLKVRLLASNPGFSLKPEMFITAAVELNETLAGIAVPARALFTEDGKNYVFVDIGNRRFERRMVAATPGGEDRWEVTSGLHTGDRIVTNGVLLLNYRGKQKQD
jgi:cobalt-zinc-cadmium efflux system membrane fusion protein